MPVRVTTEALEKVRQRIDAVEGLEPAMLEDMAAAARIGFRFLPQYWVRRKVNGGQYIYFRRAQTGIAYIGHEPVVLEYFRRRAAGEIDDPRQTRLSISEKM